MSTVLFNRKEEGRSISNRFNLIIQVKYARTGTVISSPIIAFTKISNFLLKGLFELVSKKFEFTLSLGASIKLLAKKLKSDL